MPLASWLIALSTLIGCSGTEPPAAPATLPFYDSPEFTPRWLAPDAVDEGFHRIPAFELVDHHGERITEVDLDGRVVVANFFFATCHGICPQLTESMARLDTELPTSEVLLLSHSVRPEADTVDALAQYTVSRGVQSDRWHFLTGDRQVVYHLGRHAYFVEEDLGVDKSDDDFLHTENLVLLDRSRRIRGIYDGLDATSVTRLAEDARLLIDEPRPPR